MSLLMKSMPVAESVKKSEENMSAKSNAINDELTISMHVSNRQVSSMKDEQKQKMQAQSPALKDLLMQVLNEKGESKNMEMTSITGSEIELDGVSQMTLHSFLLEAEKLGKNITYTRTLKVEITD